MATAIARPVSALASSYPAGAFIPPHHHARAQLIFGVQGVMTVQAGEGLWVVPSSHALWVPAGVEHAIRMSGQVEMRTVYIDQAQMQHAFEECQVLFVSPLLRELILRAMHIPRLYDERGMDGRIMQLILDEVVLLRPQPLGLRMPRDARLLRLCERLLGNLSDSPSISQLGMEVGLSERSIIRLFPKETGMSLGRWQMQARLMKAFELFDKGHSVTYVALELGYSSPTAFTKMFRRWMGVAPTTMLAQGSGSQQVDASAFP
ncbi:AraC family transcriptional regulator [Noviherbaspirillum pedocola]|uniref:Helix-turn-helix transcriptional regulator n=1 Tax=Noviherbaspirillum pedocola TaxID=2801341 RepID=A0A934SZE3_9BURK|nr:helix-turn-helix transcriptional regulator [Noviherbaspirillum pedocola]MBK4738513.1 helix-turn-helix transcriptional regulator [Noviherbaspirillum pedocola]